MRLPVIRTLAEFSKEHDEDFIKETIVVLEHLAGARGLKDDEVDVIGELLSNLYGSLEVSHMVESGKTLSEALNVFMSRVQSSLSR